MDRVKYRNMSNPEEWIRNVDSNEPLERIVAKINILKNWPNNQSGDAKSSMYFDLNRDVRKNSTVAFDHVISLKDIDEKAFAIRAVEFGFSRHRVETDEEKKVMKKVRRVFFECVEEFADKLPRVEDVHTRGNLAKLVATEGSLEKALFAVDVLWDMGWNTLLYPSVYEHYGIERASDFLESIAIWSPHLEVRKKALSYIGNVPDEGHERYRNEHLTNIIISKNIETAIAAVDMYIEKNSDETKKEVDAALDALFIRKRSGFGGNTINFAQPRVVEYTFDRVMELTPEEERIERAYGFVPIRVDSWIPVHPEKRPPGLTEKSNNYLSDRIDEINKIEDNKKRTNMLVHLMQFGNEETREQALDYIAQSPEGLMDSVENIAYLYGDKRVFMNLHQNVRDRLEQWACKYVREFVNLENKELAHGVLYSIGGSDEDFESLGDGWKYKDEKTGEEVDKVAREELKKLPKPPTKKDKLSDIFGVSESKP